MNIISTAWRWFAFNASDRRYVPVAKRGLIGIFALLLSVLTARSLAAAEDYEDFLNRASQNFRKNNLPEAINLYKKANAMKGNADIESLWGLVQTYGMMGAHKNVVETCDQLIKVAEKEPEYLVKAWNMRGNSYTATGLAAASKVNADKLHEAERSFREVLKLSPRSSMAHYNLGLVLIWLNRMEEGLVELRAFVNSGEEGPSVQKARKILENPRRAADNFAPDFSGVTSEGEYISSENLLGKVVLLDFWGVWCPPCLSAVPYLSRLNKKFSGQPFVLLSVDVNDEEAKWRDYISRNKMNWIHVRDDHRTIQQAFRVNAFPTYILIDHEGVILNRSLGAGMQTEDDVQSAIKRAMKVMAANPKANKTAAESARPVESSQSGH
jgi:thiol-disulfide isomerase/thioredoxin